MNQEISTIINIDKVFNSYLIKKPKPKQTSLLRNCFSITHTSKQNYTDLQPFLLIGRPFLADNLRLKSERNSYTLEYY